MRFTALAIVGFLALGAAITAGGASYQESKAAPPLQAPRFVLVPTRMAPSLASGLAEFGGAAGGAGTLSVKTQQLSPGNYWLVAIRKSDAARVTLGPLSVPDPNLTPDAEAGDDRNARSSAYQAHFLETRTLVDLPPHFDTADMAHLLITDDYGNVLLTGDPARP